jgi:hypothetical protein
MDRTVDELARKSVFENLITSRVFYEKNKWEGYPVISPYSYGDF